MGQKTGCLSVADRSNFGYIYFEKGRITYASIVNRRDRLGDILVKNGRITQEQLEAAVRPPGARPRQALGEILLVEHGCITRPDLERYMRVQIEEAVYYLFTWTQRHVQLRGGRPARARRTSSCRISPESLLLEGARRVDEWSLIEKKIPTFDLIFVVERDRLAIVRASRSTPEQERILPLLDGTRDVNAGHRGLGAARVRRRQGAVRPDHRRLRAPARAAPRRPVDAPVDGRPRRGAPQSRASPSTRRRCSTRPRASSAGWWSCGPATASAHFFLGLVALRQARWREAVDALRHAAEQGGSRPAVLHNLAVAWSRWAGSPRRRRRTPRRPPRATTDARISLGWGIVALKQGDFASAAGRARPRQGAVRRRSRPPTWYWARDPRRGVGAASSSWRTRSPTKGSERVSLARGRCATTSPC